MNAGWGCDEWFALLEFMKAGGALLLAAALSTFTAILAWFGKLITGWLHARYTALIFRLEVMKALISEIRVNVENESTWDDGAKTEIVKRMQAYRKKPYDFLPYAPVYEDNPIYDEIRKKIAVLPTAAIDSVVHYFNESNGLTAQIKDLRSQAFSKLDKRRRIEAVKAIYEDAKSCAITGRSTLATLTALIDLDQWKLTLAKLGTTVALVLLADATMDLGSMLPGLLKEAVELASSCNLPYTELMPLQPSSAI